MKPQNYMRIGAEKLAKLHEEQKAFLAEEVTNLVTIRIKKVNSQAGNVP